MQVQTSQQTVTGLTVNAKVNMQASYYRAARQMCQSMFTKGDRLHRPLKAPGHGRTYVDARLREERPLSRRRYVHISTHVKHTSDVKSGRLKSAKEDKNNKVIYPAHRGLYRRLLYFKHFIKFRPTASGIRRQDR